MKITPAKYVRHGVEGYRARWRYRGELRPGEPLWQWVWEIGKAECALACEYVMARHGKVRRGDLYLAGVPVYLRPEAARQAFAATRTFGTLYAEYAEHKRRQWSEATRRGNDGRIRRHFTGDDATCGDWAARPVATIAADDLNVAYDALIGAGHVANGAIGIMSLTKAVVRYAYFTGDTTYNPSGRVEGLGRLEFAGSPDPESPRQAINEETFAALVRHFTPEHQIIVRTMTQIGARIGEVFALRVGDVNFTTTAQFGATITIAGSMDGLVRNNWTKAERSGRKKIIRPRPLPIDNELADDLRALVQGRGADAALFAHSWGRRKQAGHWHPDTWRSQVWIPAVQRARAAGVGLVDGFTVHSLRHSLATWLSAVLTPADLMKRMRHTTIMMTMRYYHDNDAAKGREYRAVTKIFGRGRDDAPTQTTVAPAA